MRINAQRANNSLVVARSLVSNRNPLDAFGRNSRNSRRSRSNSSSSSSSRNDPCSANPDHPLRGRRYLSSNSARRKGRSRRNTASTASTASIAAEHDSKKKIFFQSLGCPRNFVDTEVMLGFAVSSSEDRSDGGDMEPTHDPSDADVVVINTCGFLESARDESRAAIAHAQEMIREREETRRRRRRRDGGSGSGSGSGKSSLGGSKLVVTGCMVNLPAQQDRIRRDFPGVDAVLPSGNIDSIVETIRALEKDTSSDNNNNNNNNNNVSMPVVSSDPTTSSTSSSSSSRTSTRTSTRTATRTSTRTSPRTINQKNGNQKGDNGADIGINDATATVVASESSSQRETKTSLGDNNKNNSSNSNSDDSSNNGNNDSSNNSNGNDSDLNKDGDAATDKGPSPQPSPAITRSRSVSTEKKRGKDESVDAANSGDKSAETVNAADNEADVDDSKPSAESNERWRVHQMAEDYTTMVGSMMYPATRFNNYGYNPQQRQYPLEKISLLGFLKSPLRRPTVIEKWSPYEIAIFEGSLFRFGKEFRRASQQIGTKTTREVIDFYYVWKKTAHYKKWKEQYVSDEDLLDDFHVPVKKPKR